MPNWVAQSAPTEKQQDLTAVRLVPVAARRLFSCERVPSLLRSATGFPRSAVIGVLGGGQLGRMMALAAVSQAGRGGAECFLIRSPFFAQGNLGVRIKCLDPAEDAPAAVAATHVKGHFRDAAAIEQFVSSQVYYGTCWANKRLHTLMYLWHKYIHLPVLR